MIFSGEIRDGEIRIDRQRFQQEIQRLDGKRIDLELRQHRDKRSGRANRYYWGVVVKLLAEYTGYEPEEMHDALKQKFLRDRENECSGLVRIKSTRKMDTAEFAAYVDRCIRLAAEMGVVVPCAESWAG